MFAGPSPPRDERVRGVQPSGHADHHLRVADRRSRCSSRHLDAVGLVAVLSSRKGSDGTKGNARRRGAVRCRPAAGPTGGHPAEHPSVGVVASVVVERPHPQAAPPRRPGRLATSGVAFGNRPIGEQDTVLPDHRLAVPGEVGGDSPSPAAAYTSREAPRRRGPAQQAAVVARPTVIGLPEMLASTVAPASAAPHGRHRNHMSSQISTCSTNPARPGDEQQVGAEGDLDAAAQGPSSAGRRGVDLPPLVEPR